MSKQAEISIDIYGQTFTIRAEPEEKENLQKVAIEVNDFLNSLSRKGTVAIHRLALMAAFQFAYELDSYKRSCNISPDKNRNIEKKLDRIMVKLNAALEEDQ